MIKSALHILSFLLFSSVFIGLNAQTTIPTTRSAKGKLLAPELNEISGLIASDLNPGSFWMHNDSGDKSRLFLVDSIGQLLQTVNLEGIVAIDMEDIAKVELQGRTYIVLADIGDNRGVRSSIKLYKFEEPKWDTTSKKQIELAKENIEVITLNYDGPARDAEAIFIDPISKNFYLISKREFQSALYTANIFNGVKQHQLKKLLSFPFTFVTAADISPTGNAILIKNLTQVYFFPRDPKEKVEQSLSKPFRNMQYEPEPQGEAISFSKDGKSFFTVSERPFGLDSYLYQYKTSKPNP